MTRLFRLKKDESQPVRVGLKLAGPRAAREGCTVHVDDKSIGSVTSGTTSPTLGYPISMAYIQKDFANPGTRVTVENRGKSMDAEVVEIPFLHERILVMLSPVSTTNTAVI